jgi:hypothetical protein
METTTTNGPVAARGGSWDGLPDKWVPAIALALGILLLLQLGTGYLFGDLPTWRTLLPSACGFLAFFASQTLALRWRGARESWWWWAEIFRDAVVAIAVTGAVERVLEAFPA